MKQFSFLTLILMLSLTANAAQRKLGSTNAVYWTQTRR